MSVNGNLSCTHDLGIFVYFLFVYIFFFTLLSVCFEFFYVNQLDLARFSYRRLWFLALCSRLDCSWFARDNFRRLKVAKKEKFDNYVVRSLWMRERRWLTEFLVDAHLQIVLVGAAAVTMSLSCNFEPLYIVMPIWYSMAVILTFMRGYRRLVPLSNQTDLATSIAYRGALGAGKRYDCVVECQQAAMYWHLYRL